MAKVQFRLRSLILAVVVVALLLALGIQTVRVQQLQARAARAAEEAMRARAMAELAAQRAASQLRADGEGRDKPEKQPAKLITPEESGRVLLTLKRDEPKPSGPQVPVNSQPSLVKALEPPFKAVEWEYPKGLLPAEFPGLKRVSGPDDPELAPKNAWRKPVALRHEASGASVSVNVYRGLMPQPEPRGERGTPAPELTEPDYQYEPARFHDVKAAAAATEGRSVLAFLHGGYLFKVEVSGGKDVNQRGDLARATAEAIWRFRKKR